MTTTLFKNAAIFDADTPELRSGSEVLIEGDRIKEVSDTPISASADTVIDLGGKALLPGLIDAHVHVNSVVISFRDLEGMPQSLVTAKSRAIMEGMLMRGFTTVRDAGGCDWGTRAAVEQGDFLGPRLFIAGKALSQTGGHGDQRVPVDLPHGCACGYFPTALGRVCDGVTEVRRAARDEIRKGADHIKIMASGGVASPSDPVDFTQFSLEEITAAVEEAEAANTYVMAHAYTGRAIRRAVECGVRTISMVICSMRKWQVSWLRRVHSWCRRSRPTRRSATRENRLACQRRAVRRLKTCEISVYALLNTLSGLVHRSVTAAICLAICSAINRVSFY
jgi:imidazolonepropionase-like amidohydrolase